MVPRPYRVVRLRRETADTVTLELEPTAGSAELAFEPGQFNMLYLFGVGEVPISLSGDPQKPSPLVHTIRRAGAVTRGLCKLRKGDVVGIRGPFGRGWPLAEAEGSDVVVVAGGIGLAPLRPAIYSLLANRKRFGRIAVLYGSRSPRDLLYRRELERWRGRFDLEVEATVDHAAGDWHGRVGVVTSLIARSGFDPEMTVAMICGPEVMMRFSARELEERGVPRENIHTSMERNMKCAIGFCGHCQFGPAFICKDGPVLPYSRLAPLMSIREV